VSGALEVILLVHLRGRGRDDGMDHHTHWLRFPYDSTCVRSRYLPPHPYAGGGAFSGAHTRARIRSFRTLSRAHRNSGAGTLSFEPRMLAMTTQYILCGGVTTVRVPRPLPGLGSCSLSLLSFTSNSPNILPETVVSEGPNRWQAAGNSQARCPNQQSRIAHRGSSVRGSPPPPPPRPSSSASGIESITRL
jgi:hypothetical protein